MTGERFCYPYFLVWNNTDYLSIHLFRLSCDLSTYILSPVRCSGNLGFIMAFAKVKKSLPPRVPNMIQDASSDRLQLFLTAPCILSEGTCPAECSGKCRCLAIFRCHRLPIQQQQACGTDHCERAQDDSVVREQPEIGRLEA